MNLKHRTYKSELLDQDDIPVDDLKRNLSELNFINTWLGGHKISVCGLEQLVTSSKEITVCEIGCGGGDNISALYSWCNNNQLKVNFIGIDMKRECIDYAKDTSEVPGVSWIISDYKKVPFKVKPDVIFSSLFCHHFTEEQLVDQLNWMRENSAKGFFINDLQRNWLAYFLIKWLTRFFSKSYLVKNDAPLSVARSFKKEEWRKLFRLAKIESYTIRWKWAFRYLVVYKHEQRKSI
ncbi:MAG TPA: methyltransferase domain-containing protein [Segetibacter sp.]|jgi:2-polyprenyl-3-methyl-5-hydroxy-6-metoxy-1,4-benzoquinol methylase